MLGLSDAETYLTQEVARVAGGIRRRVLEHTLESEELTRRAGLLQSLDPRVKLLGFLGLIVATAASRRLEVIGAIFVLASVLAVCSRVPLRTLVVRIWAGAFAFTGLIALPALFLTPGRPVGRLPWLGWVVTAQGVRGAIYLISRVETTATLSMLLVLCTPWTHVLKALRVLRVPVVLVVILGMTYRYILLMIGTAEEMFESRRSRMVGRLEPKQARSLAIASSLGLQPSPTPTKTSPITGAATIPYYAKETVGVALGRIIGYDHLSRLHTPFG